MRLDDEIEITRYTLFLYKMGKKNGRILILRSYLWKNKLGRSHNFPMLVFQNPKVEGTRSCVSVTEQAGWACAIWLAMISRLWIVAKRGTHEHSCMRSLTLVARCTVMISAARLARDVGICS